MARKKRVKMTLDPKSISDGIAEIEAWWAWIFKKARELNERLAEAIRQDAETGFATAEYDGERDVKVVAEPMSDGKGWVIKASGKSMLYLEFGAGVSMNKGDPHPNRPPGVAGIGEFGKSGLFVRTEGKLWKFRDSSGEWVWTKGNPAAMPMWNAAQGFEKRVLDVVSQVFG